MTSISSIDYAGCTGRELPGEHWNARIGREHAEQERRQAQETYPPGRYEVRLPPAMDRGTFARCLGLARGAGGSYDPSTRTWLVTVLPVPGAARPRALAGLAESGAVITLAGPLVHPAALEGEQAP